MSVAISVIVPVYNVEKYARRCFDCLIAQTYKDFEAILVDDGSTDSSGKICDEYTIKDSRFKVIHKENGGLSSARNEGIKYAVGEYIAFMDSDDMVSPDFLSRLYSAAEATGAGMTICKEVVFFSEDELPMSNSPSEATVISYADYMRDIFKYHSTYIPAWNKLYKREIFDGILFPVGKLHEDTFTTPLCAEKAEKIAVISDVLYYYYRNTSGLIHSKFSPRRFDDFEAHLRLLDRLGKMGYKDTVKEGCDWFLNAIIAVLSRKKDSFTDYKAVRKELKRQYKPIRRALLKSGTLRTDWKIIVYLSIVKIDILKSHRRLLNFLYRLIKRNKK